MTCPYQAGPDIARMIRRRSAEPQQVRTAISLERNARTLNPRMTLYRDRSAADIARRAGLGKLVDQAAADLDARPAELYEVRRIYRRRGDRRDSSGRGWLLGPDLSDKGTDVWRSLRAVATGTRTDLLKLLAAEQVARGGTIETVDGVPRLIIERATPPYPTTESFYLTVAVAGATKERPAFDELWRFVHRLDLPRQLDALSPAVQATPDTARDPDPRRVRAARILPGQTMN
ncbi:hypothetical protein ACQPYA_03805 [Micromonospora sp. CA-263727]|uniref:hypothetical protein n=1 Tax=Micromonospora sp. CA-263727 TaxID=3239967 RepID=UPI003D8CAE60